MPKVPILTLDFQPTMTVAQISRRRNGVMWCHSDVMWLPVWPNGCQALNKRILGFTEKLEELCTHLFSSSYMNVHQDMVCKSIQVSAELLILIMPKSFVGSIRGSSSRPRVLLDPQVLVSSTWERAQAMSFVQSTATRVRTVAARQCRLR